MKSLKGLNYEIDRENYRILINGRAERLAKFVSGLYKERNPRDHHNRPGHVMNLWGGEFETVRQLDEGEIDKFEAHRRMRCPELNFGWHRVVLYFDLGGIYGDKDRFILFYHANDRGDPEPILRKNFGGAKGVLRTFGNIMRNLPEQK